MLPKLVVLVLCVSLAVNTSPLRKISDSLDMGVNMLLLFGCCAINGVNYMYRRHFSCVHFGSCLFVSLNKSLQIYIKLIELLSLLKARVNQQIHNTR